MADVFFNVANAPGETPFIDKSVGAGVTLTDPTNGVATIAILAADTVSLTATDYFYDVRVELSTGDRNTVVEPSTFRVLQAVGGFDAAPSSLTAKQRIKLGVTGVVWETLATFIEGSTADTTDLGSGRLQVRVNASGTPRVTMVFDLADDATEASVSAYRANVLVEFPVGNSDAIRVGAGVAFDAGSASYAEVLASRVASPSKPTFTDKAVSGGCREDDGTTTYMVPSRKFFTSLHATSPEGTVLQPGPTKTQLFSEFYQIARGGGLTTFRTNIGASGQIAESSTVNGMINVIPSFTSNTNFGRVRLWVQFEALAGTTDYDFVIQNVEGGILLA